MCAQPQETDCDEYTPGYFLLKQEGAEPILVRKDPFKKTLEKGLGDSDLTIYSVFRSFIHRPDTILQSRKAYTNYTTPGGYLKAFGYHDNE